MTAPKDFGNLFADLPVDLAEEAIEKLIERSGVRIERIVSAGQCSPEGFWYDQHEHEFVLLLQGGAVIGFEDGSCKQLESGSWLEIPAHQKHRVEETSVEPKAIWLAMFWS